MSRVKAGGLTVALGSGIISLSPFLVEFSKVGALTNSFYRLTIGGVVLLMIALFRKEPIPQKRAWVLSAIAAAVISLDMVVWNQSVLYIGSGLATVLGNLEIIFLILIGIIFFKEKLPLWFLPICLVLAIAIGLLTYPNLADMSIQYFYGILLALSASLIFSVYVLLLKVIQTQESSALSTLPLICLFGSVMLGVTIAFSPVSFHIPDVQSLCCISANGICCQALGWMFIAQGIREISLSMSGLVMLIQPALTFLMDCLFLGRNTDIFQILGCMVLLFMIYFATTAEQKRKIARV